MFGLEMFVISHVNGDGNIFDFFSHRDKVPDVMFF